MTRPAGRTPARVAVPAIEGLLAGLQALQRLLPQPLLAVADDTLPNLPKLPAAASGASGAAVIGRDDPEASRIAALVTLAQAGDREAFGALYDVYLTPVFNYVYYRTGSRPVAEDITQETFLKAMTRIDTFAWQGRDFGAWLITIARNLTIDRSRSSTYRFEITSGDILDADRPDAGIEEMVVGRLQSVALVAALRRLKPEQQECIVLRFLQGLSVAETAKVLNRTEGAVKQLQLRALRSLARILPDGLA